MILKRLKAILPPSLYAPVEKYQRFIVYCMIGSIGASLDFAIFWYLHINVGWLSAVATILSVTVGITTTFILNAFFNFKTTDQMGKRFVRYYGVGMVGLLASIVILYVLTDTLGVDGRLVKIGSLPVIAILQYTLNAKFSFQDFESEQE